MNFEKIFTDKKNKLVMIGLFLAVLELVREKLVTAEQAKANMPIYLRALTDEPAEQAVHNAIMAQIEQQNKDDDEIQRKNAVAVKTIEDKQTQAQPPLPIKEIATESPADIPLQVEQQQEVNDENPIVPTDDNNG